MKPPSNKVDIWSLGCILYWMVSGCHLFNTFRGVFTYTSTESSPPKDVLNNDIFTISCQSFLGLLLRLSPADRPSAEACLKDPWIVKDAPDIKHSITRALYDALARVKAEAPHRGTLSSSSGTSSSGTLR